MIPGSRERTPDYEIDRRELCFPSCLLCEQIAQGAVTPRFAELFPEIPHSRQILAQNRNLLLIPDDSPITQDHLLIVTKGHFLSLASAPSETLLAIHQAKETLKAFFHQIEPDKKLLFFEHGPGQINGVIQRCGACAGTDHAHLHVIPLEENQPEVIESLNRQITKTLSVSAIEINHPQQMSRYAYKPYLYIEADGLGRLFPPVPQNAIYIPSQFIRRMLGFYLELPDQDWDLRHLHTQHRDLERQRVWQTLVKFSQFNLENEPHRNSIR